MAGKTEALADRWAPRGAGEVILLDNRDSFVFNLANRCWEIGLRVSVVRSDALSLDDLDAMRPRALLLSPGPGHPRDAGICVEAIRRYSGAIPILGVCLGHQAIGLAFGGVVEPSGAPMHGRASWIEHEAADLFDNLSSPVQVARYHSLIVREPLPDALVPLARCDGQLMAMRHRAHPTYGVQFHPESILTPDGHAMLRSFATRCGLLDP